MSEDRETDAAEAKPGRRERRGAEARARLCEAMIHALDQHGYAEATINRVQAFSGMSRGALTHHFANKQILIAETTDFLLSRAIERAKLSQRRAAAEPAAEGSDPAAWDAFFLEFCRSTWARMLSTKEGRALVEILVAVRTDAELRHVLGPRLIRWEAAMSEAILEIFEAPRGDEDARLLWGVCRTFLRGLVLHQQFQPAEADMAAFVDRFAEIMAPHLRLRRAP